LLKLDHTTATRRPSKRLRELVRGGEIGTLQYVDSVSDHLGLVQPDVDVLWDLAPARSVHSGQHPAGRVSAVAVAAHGSDPIGAGRACVHTCRCGCPTAGIAHVHVNWLSPTKIRTMIIGGSRRTVVWDDLNPAQRLSIYDSGVDRTHAGHARPGGAQPGAGLLPDRRQAGPALPEGEALRG